MVNWQSEMVNILFIHQSAELYGSDKTLLVLLEKLDKSRFHPVVVLPFDGPLKTELEKIGILVTIAPVLKLYRKMFTPKNIFLFIKDFRKGNQVLDKLNAQYHFDIVYSNTLAVLIGLIFSGRRKIKHLWHVHEIIESPKIFKKLFLTLLKLKSNTKIVFNSKATFEFWNTGETIQKKSVVVWNGIQESAVKIGANEIAEIKRKLFRTNPENLILALVGRISRWKGQLILLHSFAELNKKHKDVHLVFVGSPPPNQEIFLNQLLTEIKELNISDYVTVIPFQKEIAKIWQSIDIGVVPSTEPEPFGLVALEAMLSKKPVVASDHGGLTEIIVHNETGILVEPSDENKLEEAIQKLIENPELRKLYGERGYQRAVQNFSVDNYVNSFEEIFKSMS